MKHRAMAVPLYPRRRRQLATWYGEWGDLAAFGLLVLAGLTVLGLTLAG